jgi:D-alanyl-D-alanine carboxypeptidase/D-alanyl-D-alanine-endopeptidase (penicillin-binding protein 4)
MFRIYLIISLTSITLYSFSQNKSFETYLADSSVRHANVSFYVANADNGEIIVEFNSLKSLTPASVMKLITSAATLELLGPRYTFKTKFGYSGSINKQSGKLTGDIIIKGGGDPTLGSINFPEYNQDFITSWISEIRRAGITAIEGRIITDDSYYDYLPIPAKWLWEDSGNYYGAGVYGLSLFDNTYEIHIRSASDSSKPVITGIIPVECKSELLNMLTSKGSADKGYVFAAPYSNSGWLAGTIPLNREDFILKASVTDPPLLIAKILSTKLEALGIPVSNEPTTKRILPGFSATNFTLIAENTSPPLSKIIEVLNHESVNLYAESLTKELGKKFKNDGSTLAGIEVIKGFLLNAGFNTDGMFIEDGSGLSPVNSINTKELVNLLIFMKKKGQYFSEFYDSFADPGKEGTLKDYFTDPVFESQLKAKSGSMTRVRSYAGYITTFSGKNLAFSIIVNNYSGPPRNVVSGIESVLKEIILTY